MQTSAFDSAFPVFDSDGDAVRLGLSKREYFAAIALQGLLAGGRHLTKTTPHDAVRLADSLIERLNTNEESNSEEQMQEEEGTEA